jgi:hypothetical protein
MARLLLSSLEIKDWLTILEKARGIWVRFSGFSRIIELFSYGEIID